MLAVYANGGARFNATASREWLADVDVVEIYVDRDDGRIGIARGGDAGSGWRLQDGDAGRQFSFRGALSELGVAVADIDAPVHLDLAHDVEEGLLIADADPLIQEATDE